jgi:hypothetical protein
MPQCSTRCLLSEAQNKIEEVAFVAGCLVCELKKKKKKKRFCWSDGLCCYFGSAVILGGGSPTWWTDSGGCSDLPQVPWSLSVFHEGLVCMSASSGCWCFGWWEPGVGCFQVDASGVYFGDFWLFSRFCWLFCGVVLGFCFAEGFFPFPFPFPFAPPACQGLVHVTLVCKSLFFLNEWQSSWCVFKKKQHSLFFWNRE